jgi:tRNA pseudouridine13 synthase
LHTLLAGDLPVLHANGASFRLAEPDLASTQPRADNGELSPSAPLFGYRIDLADGVPGQWERSLLEREGLSLEAFRLRTKGESPGGARRAVRAIPEDLTWEWLPEGERPALRLRFTLPPGAYATSLLREVMKSDLAPAAGTADPTEWTDG